MSTRQKFSFIKTAAVVIIIASIAFYAPGATVNVDVNTKYQTIRGFGACSAWNGTLSASIGEQMFSMTKGAGFSLHRVMIDRDGLGNDETNNAKMAASYGATVWGAPWYCKGGVAVSGKGYDTLYESNYQAWADVLAATANKAKDAGAPLYAISSGNEADLGWTKYDQQALALWVGKYLGPTLASKAPGTKVMGVETCNWYGFDGYFKYFKNDALAWQYSSILATHEYGGSPKAYPEIQQAQKEFWETEFGFNDEKPDPTIINGIKVANMIHDALTVANMNAWHYWNVQGGNCGSVFYTDNTTKPTATKRLWVMGNYSRYARPGFVRIEATKEPATGVKISAYRDSALNKIVIIAINENTTSINQDFSIPGTTPLQLTPCITDATRDLIEQSTQTLSSSSFTYSLPTQSVTTLVISLKTALSVEHNALSFKKANFTTDFSNSNVVITSLDNNPYSISVYKSDGRCITSRKNATGRVTVPVRSKGIYVINIRNKYHAEIKRVTVN